MLKLKKVAVTGDIASGKSTICRFLEELGCFVVRADEVVAELLIPKSDIGRKVIQLLGEEILQKGKLDKKKIADEVFNNPALLSQLEAIIHPKVQAIIEERYRNASEQQFPLFVAEVPLLFEAKQKKFYDAVVFVTAERDLREARFHASKGGSPSEFLRRESRFLPFKEKIKHCQFLIENSGSFDEAREKVKNIFKQLTQHKFL